MLWVPLAPQELARFHRHPHNYQLTLRQVTLNSFGIEEYVEKKLRTHLHDYRMSKFTIIYLQYINLKIAFF
jgi:hypothetical protein